mmetsp:Transcript_117946/g.263723  ORF Transcript_117946/g.263723 Transcript_117946/m.263723 type:complete len:238 (+) Transcript_117946:9-722(+)
MACRACGIRMPCVHACGWRGCLAGVQGTWRHGTWRRSRAGHVAAIAIAMMSLLTVTATAAAVLAAPRQFSPQASGRLIRRSATSGGAAELPAPPAPASTSSAWTASASALVAGVEGCSAEEAEAWLREGFAWTKTARRFWRTTRSEAEPDPEVLQGVLAWLQDRGLATPAWVAKFPVVVGLSASELDGSLATAPSYLKSEEAFLRSIRANPKLLANNYDCLAEHESCQGRCSRCWNT